MKIKLNFEKKHLYFLIGFFVVIGIIIFVRAVAPVPNPGHSIQEVRFDSPVTDYVNGWSLVAWSVNGACFERVARAGLGESGIAGSFDVNGNSVWTGSRTGTQVCQSAGYGASACQTIYKVKLAQGTNEIASLGITEVGCGVSRSSTDYIGPAWASSSNDYLVACCGIT